MSNNYTPTKWLGGKTIGTAQVMNNIENGILSAHNRLDTIDSQVSGAKSDINDINESLNIIKQPEQSLEQTGYTKLPSGLIIQWGEHRGVATLNEFNTVRVNLPIPFPNIKLGFYFSLISNSYDSNKFSNATISDETLWDRGYTDVKINVTSDGATTLAFKWFAVGY